MIIRLFDWSFRASQLYDVKMGCIFFAFYDITCVAHFKARCVNIVATSIMKIIINVLKSRKTRNDQSNRRVIL